MKKISVKILITIFTIFLISCGSGKSASNKNQVITKYTELKTLVSAEVSDTFYLYVRLPKNYSKSKDKYPVLYLLDGDIAFDMSTSIVRYLQYAKDVPDIIIVGIGYGTMMNDTDQNFRERDYSISKINNLPQSGGSEKYLNFLEKELIPFINSSYRTNGLEILNGFSLGGLFTVNTLLTKPNLFDYYIAGSAYLISDIETLLRKVALIQNFDTNKKLFLSVGETENNEEYHKPIKKIAEKLKQIENIDLMFVEFKNGTHFTCPSEAMTYGLKFVFE
jgi:predicted alpha/beta superfamily hydrolase